MAKVIRVIAEVLERHAVADCRVCVGLSGGLDSVVLLSAMCELAGAQRLELGAVHVNHGLSPLATQWSAFCADLCDRLGVALKLETVCVDRTKGLGTEAAARALRYDVFSRIDADFVALAHHKDDQIETFLIQLLRGAGAPGLSAMPVERAFVDAGPRLLRPMLSLTRSELDAFARRRGLSWVEDVSNADVSIDRNFLRHSMLPLLEERFPAYRATLWRATQNLAEAAQLVDILGRQDLLAALDGGSDAIGNQLGGKPGNNLIDGAGLRLETLRQWPRARTLNALRCLFRLEGYRPPHRTALDEALRQGFEAGAQAQVRVDFGDVSLRRYRDCIYLVRNLQVPRDWSVSWSGQTALALPQGMGELRWMHARGTGLSAGALQGAQVRIAFRRGGERLALALDRPHRDLRKLYQEAGVAPWWRERAPLVFCGDAVVFVPGVGIAAEFQAKPDEQSFEISWVRA